MEPKDLSLIFEELKNFAKKHGQHKVSRFKHREIHYFSCPDQTLKFTTYIHYGKTGREDLLIKSTPKITIYKKSAKFILVKGTEQNLYDYYLSVKDLIRIKGMLKIQC